MADTFGEAYYAAKRIADEKAIARGRAAQAAIRKDRAIAKAKATRKARKNAAEIRDAFAA